MFKGYLDFSGGRNDTFSDLRLEDNEGPVYRNVNLDRDGAVSKRKGSQKLTALQVGAGLQCGAITYFRPTGGTAEYVAVFGTKIVRYTGVWDVLYAALTNNLLALLVPVKNLLYINNGTDNPLVYCPFATGAKVWRTGQPAPTTHPTINAAVAGAMTAGDILVRVRYVGFVDDSFVGEPDSEDGTTFTVSVSGGVKINIPVFAGADFRVAKRLIERTKVGGGVFFIDGYVADNVTTTYNIVQSDAALEGNDVAPDLGSRGVPGKLWPFCLARNRIVGWNAATRRVEWSTIDEFGILPEAFPQENFVYLDITDGEDEPTACLRFADQVIFYCGRSIHRVTIDDGGQGAALRIDGWEVGIPSPRAAIEVPGGHLVWTYRGPFFFDGDQMNPVGERIEVFTKSLDMPTLKDLFVIHRYDRRQVKFVLPIAGSQHLNAAAIYHYRMSRGSNQLTGQFVIGAAWTIHDGFEARSGCIGRDTNTKLDVEVSGDYDGYVRVEDFGDREDFQASGAIEGEFITKWLDAGNPFMVKEFSDIWVVIESEAAGNITVNWESEFGEGTSGVDVLESDVAAALFDTARFDVSTFAGGANKVIHAFTAQDGLALVGRHVRFRFSNYNASEPFTILGFLLQFEPVRDRSDGA